MNVEQWTNVFQTMGLNEEMMGQWHREFERLYPEQHESFLQWLNVSSHDIQQIRKEAQGAR